MVAANVPISPGDPRRGQPPALHAWPPWTTVIDATLKARGEPARDLAFPVRSLPLSLADARPVTVPGQPTLEYVLRAGVNGYNVDASVTFASEPTAAMFEKAEEQIARLVVAPAAITITVRPTIYSRTQAARRLRLGDEREGGREGDAAVQAVRALPAPVPRPRRGDDARGRRLGIETGVLANGVFRALSGGDVSNEVQVQKRADIRLEPSPARRFEVHVVERMSFWRKQVLIQRFHRGQRKWLLVKKLRLVNSDAAPGSSFVWSSTDEFTVDVAKGTTVRAVLPLAQAKPCHIGGYSNLLVTK